MSFERASRGELPMLVQARSRHMPDPDAALIGLLCIVPALLIVLTTALSPRLDTEFFLAVNRSATLLPDPLWAVLATLGGGSFIAAVALPFVQRDSRASAAFVLLFFGLGIGINLIKDLFHTLRPTSVLAAGTFHLIGPGILQYAFPSGHAASAFAVALLLIQRLKFRLLPALALLGGAGAISVARLAVGVHWPLDVAAGALLGSATAWGCLALTQRFACFAHRAWQAAATVFMMLVALRLFSAKGGFADYAGVLELRYGLAALLTYELGKRLWQARTAAPFAAKLGRLAAQAEPVFLRLVRFGSIGLSGFFVDLFVYTMLFDGLGFAPDAARASSYWIAASSNWFFNRLFTFRDRPPAALVPQWLRYLALCAVSFLPNFGTFGLLVHGSAYFAAHTQLALAAGVLAGVLFNFVGASRWVFAPRAGQGALQ